MNNSDLIIFKIGRCCQHKEGRIYKILEHVEVKTEKGWFPGIAYTLAGKHRTKTYIRTFENFKQRFIPL